MFEEVSDSRGLQIPDDWGWWMVQINVTNVHTPWSSRKDSYTQIQMFLCILDLSPRAKSATTPHSLCCDAVVCVILLNQESRISIIPYFVLFVGWFCLPKDAAKGPPYQSAEGRGVWWVGRCHAFRKAGNLIPKKLQNQKQRTRALVGGDRQEHSGALRTRSSRGHESVETRWNTVQFVEWSRFLAPKDWKLLIGGANHHTLFWKSDRDIMPLFQ